METANRKDHSMIDLDKRKLSGLGIKLGKAKIMNCAYLAENEGYYILGPVGMSDPEKISEVLEFAIN